MTGKMSLSKIRRATLGKKLVFRELKVTQAIQDLSSYPDHK